MKKNESNRKLIEGFKVLGLSYRPVKNLIIPEYYAKDKIHGRENFLYSSITECGFANPIIINVNPTRMNVVIDGRNRLEFCKQNNVLLIRVFKLWVNKTTEKRLHVLLNEHVSLNDPEKLIEFLEGLSPEDFGLLAPRISNIKVSNEKTEEQSKILGERRFLKMSIAYNANEYAFVKENLTVLKKTFKANTNSEVIITLIKQYNEHNPH